LDIGYVDDSDADTKKRAIAGDVFIGNKKDGYFTINLELTVKEGAEGPLDFGDEEYDLSEGRCFVVKKDT